MSQFEWVSLPDTDLAEGGVPGGPAWFRAATPGSVHRDAVAGTLAMHFAPGRWLLVGPRTATLALVDALSATVGGVGADVTGKYAAIPLRGQSAGPTLASALNVAAVLPAGRQCAAAMPFDCPAVVVREEDGFTVWVASSHVRDFTAATERAASVCEKMTG